MTNVCDIMQHSIDPSSDSATDNVPPEPVSQHASTNFQLALLTLTDASHFQFYSGLSQVSPALTPATLSRFVGAHLPTTQQLTHTHSSYMLTP